MSKESKEMDSRGLLIIREIREDMLGLRGTIAGLPVRWSYSVNMWAWAEGSGKQGYIFGCIREDDPRRERSTEE